MNMNTKIRNSSVFLLVPLVAIAVGLTLRLRAACAAAPPPSAAVVDLMARDLPALPGKEVRMLTVELAAGASSSPHRHDAEVFVYVLQGTLRMQVQGSPLVTLKAGDTFHEGPNDVHTVSANASDTESAKFLVFLIKDKAAPITTPVGQRPQS
jgi:quercetin dioxygenase-like cupin family protein